MSRTRVYFNQGNFALTNLTVKFAGFGVAFISSAFSAKSYGPAKFGTIILAVFAQYLLCELTDLGSSTFVARQLAQTNSPLGNWISHIPRILFRSCIAMGIWVITVLSLNDDKYSINLILVLNIPFWLCNSYFQQVAYAKGELGLANTELFLQNFLLIMVFPLSYIFSQFYELGIVLSSFLSFIFSLSASVLGANFKGNHWQLFPENSCNFLQNEGIRLAPSRILGLVTYLDTLAVGILLGPSVAGFYSLASRMRAVLPAGLISISDATYSRTISTRKLNHIFASLESKIIMSTTLAFSILIYFFAPYLIDHLFGSAYIQSVVYFRFFIVISLAIGIVYILKNILIAWNQDTYISIYVYLATFLQLLIAILLTFVIKIYSIPLALLCSNLFLIFTFAIKVRTLAVTR